MHANINWSICGVFEGDYKFHNSKIRATVLSSVVHILQSIKMYLLPVKWIYGLYYLVLTKTNPHK